MLLQVCQLSVSSVGQALHEREIDAQVFLGPFLHSNYCGTWGANYNFLFGIGTLDFLA